MRLRSIILICFQLSGMWAETPSLESLEKASHWKRLRSQVEIMIRNHPNDPVTLLWASRVKEAFGDIRGAYAAAKRSTSLAPQSADAWAQLSSTSGQLAGASSFVQKMKVGMECKNAGEKALSLDKRNHLALIIMARWYESAPSFMGGKASAEACRQTLREIYPDFTYRLEIDQAIQSKDPEKIETALQKAIKERSGSAWPFLIAAGRCLDPGSLRPQEAERSARKALALDPDNVEAHGRLAGSLAAQGKWKEMGEVLSSAERRIPDNLYPYYLVGEFLITTNQDPGRAEACFRKYLTQEPEAYHPSLAHAHRHLGLALERQGRKPEALQEIRIALKLKPDFPEARSDMMRLN